MMGGSRPLIGVTGVPITAGGVLGWRQGATAAPDTYLQALERAGADGAVLMPVPLDEVDAVRRLRRFDGLVVVGGGDVDPARYGAEARPEVAHVQPARDDFEIPLLRAAVEMEVPVLAICRGIQVLNVALGGTLHQHISDWSHLAAHRSPDGSREAFHEVRIEPGTRLHKAVGAERVRTFSHHHQAVDVLGDGLAVVAWADDGLPEGVEHERGWVVGIQWHAEATAAGDPFQQNLFGALVVEAKGG